MQIEERQLITSYKIYWVTDNEGKRHLCHDPVYAQWLENKYIQERKEKQNANAETGKS